FSRTLGNLIEHGVPILNALQIVGEIATNKVFAAEIKHSATLVSKGQHLHEALRNSRILEQNTLDLIAVGEESGKIEEMLLRVAVMNETEASQHIETIMFMLEPALILILGGIMAFIVMAILLPIFQMNFLIQ
ncbi:MAG: type II secretion system F family protein, partial [Candidatus Omnitrophica bacterium]|nr:type II secretion system F family protein [Candidatus Omnitrophota bacterium]